MSISGVWARLARAVRWHRRPLAAVAAACAVLVGLASLQPSAAPTVPVVVAATDLAAGHALGPKDLRVARYPAALAPSQALADPAELTGRVLAAPAAPGTPLTPRAMVSTSLSPGPGELLAPFRVADAGVLRLVRPGDRVTVVAAGQDQQVVTLAQRVRVVSVPEPDGTQDGALVVVSADPTTASRLAGWSSGQGLGLALG